MRILIVKISALGDVVHALPVLDYLHQTVKGVEIDWVVEESFREVLEGNPLLSELHFVRFKSWKKKLLSRATWSEIGKVKSDLVAREYDVVFDLQGNIKSGLITWLTGSGKRFGFDREGARELPNTWFTSIQVPLRKQDYHITDRALRVISVLYNRDYAGMKLHTDIVTAPEDDHSAEVLMATLYDGLVFVLHHGTTWQTKLWHEDGWVALGRGLLELFPDANILLSWGGETEFRTAERIAAGIGNHARVLPRLSLKGFAALLKKADLMVGGDTGPIHIAAAVGTPTVSFYRATDGRRNGPRGELHRIVQAPLPCTRCLNRECDRDPECRQSISVEMMLKNCRELLDTGSESPISD